MTDDFPTFGRPTKATWSGWAGSGSASPAGPRRRPHRGSSPRRCRAETGNTGNPSRAKSAAWASRPGWSALLAARKTGRPLLRSSAATSSVLRQEPGGRVGDEQDGGGVADRGLHLEAHAPLNLRRRRRRGAGSGSSRPSPAGVNQLEAVSFPLGLRDQPVAGNTPLGMDQGHAPSGQQVEQRRLADIRPADDCRRAPG